MNICVVGTLNLLFIRSSYAESKIFNIRKKFVAKLRFL